MKNKFFRGIALTLATTVMLTACGNSSADTTTGGDTSGSTATDTKTDTNTDSNQVLKVWSFTNEARAFTTAFMEANPGVQIEYTMVPMDGGEYQAKLQQALASGKDVPDVVVLEASFVRQYVESPFLADLGELKPKADELEIFPFTVEVGTYEGVTKAYSYQAAPGALFYRRSLAKEYFGTDEPAEIQALMSDFDKYKDASEVVKEKSGGNTYMVGSSGDFIEPFLSNRSQPWIVDDTLVIDPKVDELFDVAKEFRDNGYEAQTVQWIDGWFSGMNDTLTGADGTPKQVFSYFLPTWGLPYVLMQNCSTDATDTYGDWAVIEGPSPYQWGGTWFSVARDAENPELAKQFVEFAALNEQTLTDWATGKYTNEYLTSIDPGVGDLFQGPGDFISSAKVAREIQSQFDDAETSKFLSGQNSYEFFAEAAPNVSVELMQATDDVIKRTMQDALELYVSGEATKEEAMNTFKENIKALLPDVKVE